MLRVRAIRIQSPWGPSVKPVAKPYSPRNEPLEEQRRAPRPQEGTRGSPPGLRLVAASPVRRGRWLVAGATVVASRAASRVCERHRRQRDRQRTDGKQKRSQALHLRHGSSLPRTAVRPPESPKGQRPTCEHSHGAIAYTTPGGPRIGGALTTPARPPHRRFCETQRASCRER